MGMDTRIDRALNFVAPGDSTGLNVILSDLESSGQILLAFERIKVAVCDPKKVPFAGERNTGLFGLAV